jgi:hypothetical protein
MTAAEKKMFQGTRAILNYRRERDLLVSQIKSYISTLRAKPEGNYLAEITLNIQSLAMQANKVKWASETLAVDAKDMNYVTSKEANFFSHTIPRRCNSLGTESIKMYKLLLTHQTKPLVNIEHELAIDLETILTNLGFN